MPRPFLVLGELRRLLVLLAVALLAFAAMLPAMRTMAGHGHSVIAFESAGSVEKSEEVLGDWGDAGVDAAWWQLALDTPLLVAYGLLGAAACAAVSRRAARVGMPRLQRAAAAIAWLAPLAAVADLTQNVALALVLSGQVVQPWPRIAAICVPAIIVLSGAALGFALAGWLATRRTGRGRLRPRASG